MHTDMDMDILYPYEMLIVINALSENSDNTRRLASGS